MDILLKGGKMDYISEHELSIFMVQSVVWDGHLLFKSLRNVPMEKRKEEKWIILKH